VYRVEDSCGEFATTTQTVTYSLESVIQITAVPPPEDFGCVTAPPVIPGAGSITTTGNVLTVDITDIVTTNGCDVTLVREWTATGCCGLFDQAVQTYTWTETPGAPSLIGPLQLELGCIADEGQIPQPSTSQFTPVAGCGSTGVGEPRVRRRQLHPPTQPHLPDHRWLRADQRCRTDHSLEP